MSTANLYFDGYNLSLIENGAPIRSWAAVSGNVGYQSPQYQGVQDTGPIPEGSWSFSLNDTQMLSWVDSFLGVFSGVGIKVGAWPGSTFSWGNMRVFLDPVSGTDAYGRSGFSIHGGYEYGSAGCIDLGGNEIDFFLPLQNVVIPTPN